MIDVRQDQKVCVEMASILSKVFPEWPASEVAKSISDMRTLGWGKAKLIERLDEMRRDGAL